LLHFLSLRFRHEFMHDGKGRLVDIQLQRSSSRPVIGPVSSCCRATPLHPIVFPLRPCDVSKRPSESATRARMNRALAEEGFSASWDGKPCGRIKKPNCLVLFKK
jgi:hypothetical protein